KLYLKKNNIKNNNLISVSKAKMEYVRKNIDYKKLGYTSPNDYILKTKNVYLNYAERSSVPIELYDDILFQLKHNLYPQLF
ncbi:MAG TPA: hypothetical protein P5215_06700, partial [Bacteroidales bacterium]|nr:hypothetical protein [Bacteroidales bacterium]